MIKVHIAHIIHLMWIIYLIHMIQISCVYVVYAWVDIWLALIDRKIWNVCWSRVDVMACVCPWRVYARCPLSYVIGFCCGCRIYCRFLVNEARCVHLGLVRVRIRINRSVRSYISLSRCPMIIGRTRTHNRIVCILRFQSFRIVMLEFLFILLIYFFLFLLYFHFRNIYTLYI